MTTAEKVSLPSHEKHIPTVTVGITDAAAIHAPSRGTRLSEYSASTFTGAPCELVDLGSAVGAEREQHLRPNAGVRHLRADKPLEDVVDKQHEDDPLLAVLVEADDAVDVGVVDVADGPRDQVGLLVSSAGALVVRIWVLMVFHRRMR